MNCLNDQTWIKVIFYLLPRLDEFQIKQTTHSAPSTIVSVNHTYDMVLQCNADTDYPELAQLSQTEGRVLHRTPYAAHTRCKLWGSLVTQTSKQLVINLRLPTTCLGLIIY